MAEIKGISCGKLTTGIVGFDCANPLVAGIKPNVVLFNLDDINHSGTTLKDGVLTALELKDGAQAFLASTLDNGVDASITFNKGTYINSWSHSFTFRLFDNSPAAKRFIHDLEKSRIVAIIQNNYVKNEPLLPEIKGETVFEVYGFNAGLILTEATRDPKDAESKGGYILTVASDENAQEPTLPITLFNIDLEATEAILEGLLAPVTP